jgi:GGDEF domain-containing protein
VALFKRADEALQAAKEAGRNRVMAAPESAALDV